MTTTRSLDHDPEFRRMQPPEPPQETPEPSVAALKASVLRLAQVARECSGQALTARRTDDVQVVDACLQNIVLESDEALDAAEELCGADWMEENRWSQHQT